MRAIVTLPGLSPEALAALKQWLGITTPADDVPLSALLRMALEACENFTSIVPLVGAYEELLPLRTLANQMASYGDFGTAPYRYSTDWQVLKTRPVQAIIAVSGIMADGTRFALPSSAYETVLDADGAGFVRVIDPGMATRFVVRFTAGLATDWGGLPEALRQGIIRLAAHQHRTRESDGAAPLPPASVAALWRPWRRLRII